MEPRDIARMKADLGLMLADLRDAKGWSQQQLITEGQVHTSRSTVANTETGRQFPDERFWAECDGALDANGELLAAYCQIASAVEAQRQIAAEAARSRLEESRRSWRPEVHDLESSRPAQTLDRRTLLASLPLLTAALTPHNASVIEAQVSGLWNNYQQSQLQRVVENIPALLANLQAHISDGAQADERRYRKLLALTYQLSATVMTKLGLMNPALNALDYGIRAAENSGNQIMRATLTRSKAHTLYAAGFPYEAATLIEETLHDLSKVDLKDSPSGQSVLGTLRLVAAAASASEQDRGQAEHHLKAAESMASRLGKDANLLWTSFGPTNVAIHRVVVAIELGHPRKAIDLAGAVKANSLPMERRIRHSIETARAYSMCGMKDEALSIVLEAEKHAPEQVRNHRLSRTLVSDWFAGPRVRHEVASLAHRMNLDDSPTPFGM